MKMTQGEIYEVTVEKIYPGVAVVRVNDNWRARLTPEEFNGPRKLIKKDSTFTAVGELYRMNGILCLRVKHVTRIGI